MENTKKITEYTKIIAIVLLAIGFTIFSPMIVKADDFGWDEPYSGGSDNGWDNPYTYTGGDDYGWDNPYSGGGSYSWDNPYSGGFTYSNPNLGSVYYYGNGGGYSNYSGFTVNTGGFSGGNAPVVPNPVTPPDPINIISGTFIPGNNPVIVPIEYSYEEPIMTTGSFSVQGAVTTQPQTTYIQPIQNQVLAYTDTNPKLNSVYLSDVPYTGFEDYYGIIIFISILILLSAVSSYILLKRKIASQEIPATVCVEKNEEIKKSMTSDLDKQNISDNSDFGKVEEYARMNKVLLSSDAIAKIIKLSRMGKINASEYIRSVAKGEWVAIGENQINS